VLALLPKATDPAGVCVKSRRIEIGRKLVVGAVRPAAWDATGKCAASFRRKKFRTMARRAWDVGAPIGRRKGHFVFAATINLEDFRTAGIPPTPGFGACSRTTPDSFAAKPIRVVAKHAPKPGAWGGGG